MPFECPECDGNETLQGAYFETCAGCGWSGVDAFTRVKLLSKERVRLTAQVSELTELKFEWASYINRLACIALSFDEAVTINDMDFVDEMIEEINPYLGLASE